MFTVAIENKLHYGSDVESYFLFTYTDFEIERDISLIKDFDLFCSRYNLAHPEITEIVFDVKLYRASSLLTFGPLELQELIKNKRNIMLYKGEIDCSNFVSCTIAQLNKVFFKNSLYFRGSARDTLGISKVRSDYISLETLEYLQYALLQD